MWKNSSHALCYLLLTFTILFCSCPGNGEVAFVPDIQLSDANFFYKSAETDSRSFSMEVNTDWIVSVKNKKDNTISDWLTVSQESGQAGKFNIKIYISGLNREQEARTAIIEIKAGDLTRNITVKQNGIATISIETKEIFIKGTEAGEIKFSVDDKWTISPASVSWGTFSSTSGEAGDYTISFTPNATNNSAADISLEAYINSDGSSEPFTIIHKADLESYNDKDVVQLQTATQVSGVDLIFMGDGFTRKDMEKEEGKYEKSIRQAVDHFFSIEPYISYRKYFNVYMVVAESAEEGVKNELGDVNNKFSSIYQGGTLINCNYHLCREYVELVTQFKGETVTEFGDLTAILVLNSTKYAGTCLRWADGFTLSLCPMSTSASPYDFKGVINHEAGGHGFALLADEYVDVINKDMTIPQFEIDQVRATQAGGDTYFNVDFTSNLSQILWKGFIGHSKYSMVGAYEGAYYYGHGVWRPEVGSCMINNIPYYNAPSRWAVVNRIMMINNVSFSLADFMNVDIIDVNGLKVVRTKGAVMDMPPLAPPVFIE